MKETSINAMRIISDALDFPVVIINFGGIAYQEGAFLEVEDDEHFMRWACASHLEEYGFAQVEIDKVSPDSEVYDFYTEEEFSDTAINLGWLIKFISDKLVEAETSLEFEKECIGRFNQVWKVITRKEND